MPSRILAAGAAIVAGTLLVAAPATAQTSSPSAPTEKPGKQFSDEKLDAFVDAAISLLSVRESWKPKIQAAPNKQEAQRLANAAKQEMAKAVEDSPGITKQEYTEIALAAQSDPELANRLKTKLQETLRTRRPG